MAACTHVHHLLLRPCPPTERQPTQSRRYNHNHSYYHYHYHYRDYHYHFH